MVRPKTGQKYVYTVLVDEETYKLILGHKRYHEPMGSAAQRLIAAGQQRINLQRNTRA